MSSLPSSQADRAEQTRWFAEEVQPHEAELRAYLRHRFPGVYDVDDLVQESFMRILQARTAGKIACARAYLFTVARNLAFGLFRRPQIFAEASDENPATHREVEDTADVVEQVSTNQEVALLFQAIDRLPSRCREIFILRKLQGLPPREIAQRLSLSEQTVQVQLARGASKCVQFLRAQGVTR